MENDRLRALPPFAGMSAAGLARVAACAAELEAEAGRPLMNASHAMFAVGYAVSALATGFEREAGLPPAAALPHAELAADAGAGPP